MTRLATYVLAALACASAALAQPAPPAPDAPEPGPLTREALAQTAAIEQRFAEIGRLRAEQEQHRVAFEAAQKAGDLAGGQEISRKGHVAHDRIIALEKEIDEGLDPLRKLLAQTIAQERPRVDLHATLAKIAALKGEAHAALAASDAACALDPTSIDLRYDRALYAMKAMDWAKAIADFEACAAANHKMPYCAHERARGLVWTHQFEAAIAAIDTLLPAASKAEKKSLTSLRLMATDYVDLWKHEQELRKAEAERDDLPRVKLVTAKGEILLELFEDQAPMTVANFVTLVESGFYTSTRFHRKVEAFMIQGGCPNTRQTVDPSTHGQGHPGYLIPDELGPAARAHFAGSLTMANGGQIDTNGSQFMITHVPAGWLNVKRRANHPPVGHTVFGRVIAGFEIALKLDAGDELVRAEVLRKRDHAYEIKRKLRADK